MKIKHFLQEWKRISFDFILWLAFFSLFLFTNQWESLSYPVQSILFKACLVSMGFIHAHVMRKIAFPKIDWIGKKGSSWTRVLAIALYVTVILAYARGG